MIEERQNEAGIEVFDQQIGRPPVDPLRRETNQQREGVRIGGHRMRTGAAFAGQMLAQERGEMGSQSGHAAPPSKSCSFALAMSCSRTGVASRYQ
jgi:phage portal protein BeeE